MRWFMVLGLVGLVGCSISGEEPAASAPSRPAAVAGGAGGGAPKASAEAPPASKGKREDVTMDEFIARHGQGLQIVDVRTDGEWATGHVPGAVHVPIDELSAEHPGLAGLDKSKPIYFVCAVGGRSSAAAREMSAAGLHAVNVQGGTEAWKAKGQAVTMPGNTP